MKVYMILSEYKDDYGDWHISDVNSVHLFEETAINIVHKLNDELIAKGCNDEFNYYMEIKEAI